LPYEDFVTMPKIRKNIKCRESLSILRNRMYQLQKHPEKFNSFISDLEYILKDKSESIEFSFIGQEYKDVSLSINIKIGGRDVEKELSLLGSGTLQIIELLLTLYDEQNELQIILLDEPDSHIHRDIQKRLIKILVDHTTNAQVFITTHNESLIRSSNPRDLFYLEPSVSKEYWPIIKDETVLSKVGLQPSKNIKILSSLGSENGLDIVNALEADRLILVEGMTDAKYIQTILEKNNPNERINVMYWSFNGIDNILKKIAMYKEFFSLIKNGESLWDKSVLVLDSDYVTDKQRELIEEKIQEKYNIKTYIWKSYTIESTVLLNNDEFKKQMYSIVKRLSNNSNIDKSELYIYIDSIIDDIAKVYLEKLNNEDDTTYLKSISNIIKTRKDNINDAVGRNTIFKSDLELYAEHKKYVKPLLERDVIYPIADKDIVKYIIKKVFEEYDVNTSDCLDEFELFINQVTRGDWFSEWDDFISVLNSR
ncbi:MAG: ATP-dependent nuclease, partial [Paraclostridium sp.]